MAEWKQQIWAQLRREETRGRRRGALKVHIHSAMSDKERYSPGYLGGGVLTFVVTKGSHLELTDQKTKEKELLGSGAGGGADNKRTFAKMSEAPWFI